MGGTCSISLSRGLSPTGRYPTFTLAFSTSLAVSHVRVCFIHALSSRSGKSSLECAPRDSLRFSAATMVCVAWFSRFSSSNVSIRSVFHTELLSLTLTLSKSFITPYILSTPSLSEGPSLKTAAWFCMIFCILVRICAVVWSPLACRILSRRASVSSPAFLGRSTGLAFGFIFSEMVSAAVRPNTTMSSSELAPSLLAPCTLAHAASPAARRPGTIESLPSLSVLSTSALQLVGTPPIL
mmetsp:Transcript_2203/g.5020  ORF Transcript_2203/g.5020 Transcript_2203/m.5020 type:complete len:239 (-) Transcript_2203:1267-1983(-)